MQSSTTTTRRRPLPKSAMPATTTSACDILSVRFRRRSSIRRSTISFSSFSSSQGAAPKPLMLLFVAIASFFFANKVAPVYSLSAAKNEWINSSLNYYNRITRGAEHVQESPTYLKSAMENYFALEKLRDNKPHHAEFIYRRLMTESHPHNNNNNEEIVSDHHRCEYSELAVPTLLLGLLLQREERFEDARLVFEGFSHALEQKSGCCCCARVLQAHALFEMKQDRPIKAAELIMRAVRMDSNLKPVLRWKRFQIAMIEYRKHQRQQQMRKVHCPYAGAIPAV